MAKMTKTQSKRAYLSIKQKAKKLWLGPAHNIMSTSDMVAIEKICNKYLKKF